MNVCEIPVYRLNLHRMQIYLFLPTFSDITISQFFRGENPIDKDHKTRRRNIKRHCLINYPGKNDGIIVA